MDNNQILTLIKQEVQRQMRSAIAKEVKRNLGGADSLVLRPDAKDSRGRLIKDIGGEVTNDTTINSSTISGGGGSVTEDFSARFDKDRCLNIDGKSIQLQMTAPESKGYERFIIKKTRNLVDIDQSTKLEVQEVTSGIPDAIPWPISTPVDTDTYIHPTNPDGTYWRCTTAGTTDATEPPWTGTTVTETGGVVWELQEKQPVINTSTLTGDVNYGASRNGLRIVGPINEPNGAWDFGWGPHPKLSGNIDYTGQGLLFSKFGKPYKQFRLWPVYGTNEYSVKAKVIEIDNAEWYVGATRYGRPRTITIDRPLATLPNGMHYAIDVGVSWAEYCPYDVIGYEKHGDNIYTKLAVAPGAKAEGGGGDGSTVWYTTYWSDTGDDITFILNMRIDTVDGVYGLDKVVPLATDSGVGAIVSFNSYIDSRYTGAYYSCKRFFLYKWHDENSAATIKEITIDGYDTNGWHGTAAWDGYVTANIVDVAYDGGKFGIMIELGKSDAATPEYYKKFYVSDNGAQFKLAVTYSDTVAIPALVYGLGYQVDYFLTLTFAETLHLCVAHGEFAGTTYKVYSCTTGFDLRTGTMPGALGYLSQTKMLLSYAMPDTSSYDLTRPGSKVNILCAGPGYCYMALRQEVIFGVDEVILDFTTEITGKQKYASNCTTAKMVNKEMFLNVQYSTTDLYPMRIKLTIDFNRNNVGTEYNNSTISVDTFTLAEHQQYIEDVSPMLGEAGMWVEEIGLNTTYVATIRGGAAARIFTWRYDENPVQELGRIDGTVFHYAGEKALLSDGYILLGMGSDLKKKRLDTIAAADLVGASEYLESSSMQLATDVPDGELFMSTSGQAAGSGIDSDDVMLQSVYDTDGDGKVDDVAVSKAGVSGGKTIVGGTGVSENLALESTSHAAKGQVRVGDTLFINEANNQIGINTSSPDSPLTILSLSGAAATHLIADGSYVKVQGSIYSGTAWHGMYMQGNRYRGTNASPAAVALGDFICSLYAAGYDGTIPIEGAKISMIVDGTVAAGIVPIRIGLFTMDASGSYAERMTIKSSGNVGIGTSSPTEKMEVIGNVKIGDPNPIRLLGVIQTTADPTTTELPSASDCAIHKNTTSGKVYLAYNDGGTIKKVELI